MMPARGEEFRELLVADLALVLGVAPARDVAAALQRYWDDRNDRDITVASELQRIAGLDDEQIVRLTDEVARILEEAGGDAQRALAQRGGIDRSIHASLQPGLARELTDTEGRSRPSLRTMPRDRYVQFSPIGQGGMGVVYLAVDTELNRHVALKIIRAGSPGPDTTSPLELTPPREESPASKSYTAWTARFLQEVWVTGGLEHPGIVPVYEVGQTPHGVPYYTMRLVRGKRTLADAIDEASTFDERIGLIESFLKVCDAIRYAHSRGVIHRDLKPANIALGEFGEVVVLDWGLAKMRDRPDLAGSVWQERVIEFRESGDLETVEGMLGTPGYMSPEAAMGEAEHVNERSDVYSLGAILYKILTGHLPVEGKTFIELVKNQLEKSPSRPGEVDVAVPGELSDICMKALARDPDDRFVGADALASAIRAWQRASAVEREAQALLRDAEVALAASDDLAGSAQLRQLELVATTCARVRELRPGDERAKEILERARAARDRAIAGREKATRRRLLKRVAAVVLLVGAASALIVAVLLDARAREAVRLRVRAEEMRGRAEELAGFMIYDLRDSLEPIGRLDLMEPVVLKAKAYYESLDAEDLTPKSRRRLWAALVNLATIEQDKGNTERALELCREALPMIRALQTSGPERDARMRDLGVTQNKIAWLLRTFGDTTEALALFRKSLALYVEIVSRNPKSARFQASLAHTHSRLGHVLGDLGNIKGRLEHNRAALEIREMLLRRKPESEARLYEVATAQGIVGTALKSSGDIEGALKHYRSGLAIRKKLAGKDPNNMDYQRGLSWAHINVCSSLEERKDFPEALDHGQAALDILDRLARHDPTNVEWQSDLLSACNSIGEMHRRLYEFKQALAILARGREVGQRTVALAPSNMAWLREYSIVYERIGDIREKQKDFQQARAAYANRLRITEKLAQQDPENAKKQRDLAIAHERMGRILLLLGESDAARTAALESVRLAEHACSIDKNNMHFLHVLAWNRYKLAKLHVSRGEFVEALAAQLKASQAYARLVEKMPHVRNEQDDTSGLLKRIHVLSGEKKPEDARDHLALADWKYDHGNYAGALPHFEVALGDQNLYGDLERSNLYRAACAASLRAAAGDPDDEWKTKAFAWLVEDVAQRRAMAAKVDELIPTATRTKAGWYRHYRRMVLAVIDRARDEDPNLAFLRALPEFKAIFEK